MQSATTSARTTWSARASSGRGTAAVAALLLTWALTASLPATRAEADTGSGLVNTTHFMDTFSSGRLAGWAHRDEGSQDGPSNWRVSSGALRETSNIFGGGTARTGIVKPGTLLAFGNPAWSDYDYSVSLRSGDDDAIGVVFRYQDSQNYYRFSMDAQRHYRRLVRVLNGHYTLLAEARTGYVKGKTYRVRVLANGPGIRVFLNGAAVFDVQDDKVPAGRIGLYTWGSASTTADNVAVDARTDSGFTVAVVPDTQNEAQNHPEQLHAQMQWLAAARGRQNIALVLQEGDIVNRVASGTQWATASKYYKYLDGKVPFVVAVGNHDEMQSGTSIRPLTVQPKPYNAFIAGFKDYEVAGVYKTGDNRNSYHLLDAGGVPLLVLNLEFGAPTPVLDWAGGVVDRYPTRHVLLLTHDYLDVDGHIRGTDPNDTSLPQSYNRGLNDGATFWDKLIDTHPNIQFTFNGHVITTVSESQPWSVGRSVKVDQAGRSVYQTLTNYQTYGSGQGYLRLFHFSPGDGRVDVSTYSPYTGEHLADAGNRFTIDGVDLGAWSPLTSTSSATP